MQVAAKATLESLVEERVASLIREAATVQRHTKRLKTTAAAAAATTTQHPITTTFATPPSRTQSLQARHVHLALAWRGEEALLAPSLMGGHVTHSHVHDSPTTMDDPPLEKEKDDANHYDASARGDEYHQDAPIDLSILLQLYGNQEHHHMTHHGPTNHSHYGPPLEVTLQCHWLAVHGVTPTDRPMTATNHHHRTTYYAPSHHPALIRSDDDDHENEDDDDALVANHHGGTHPHHASVGGVSVRQLLPRLLSEELRLYFTRITLALEQPPLPPSSSSSSLQVSSSSSYETQEAALESVARDSGTQELVPFFVRYVALQLQSFLSSSADDSSHHPRKAAATTTTTTTQRARTFVRLAKALLDNPNLHLELFLHQLLPALLSCVVASKSSSSSNNHHIPYNEEEEDDSHWYLREEAAAVVVQLAHQFGSQYTTLQARILETLCRALHHNHSHDTCQNPETLYGGLVGMRLFGPRSIDAFVIPLVATIWTTTASTGQEQQPSHQKGRDNMSYCQFALLEGLGLFLRHVSLHEQAQRLGKQHPEVASALGETLVYLLSGRMADNDNDDNNKPTKHPGDPHPFPNDDSYHGGWQPSAYSTCIL